MESSIKEMDSPFLFYLYHVKSAKSSVWVQSFVRNLPPSYV